MRLFPGGGLCLILMLASCHLLPPPEPPAPSKPEGDWLFIFYLAADNTLSDNIKRDLDEILAGHFDPGQIRLLVFFDPFYNRHSLHDSTDLPGNTGLYEISRPGDWKQINLKKAGFAGEYELDSADPATLQTLLSYTESHYSPDYRALFMGSHGNGWFPGFQDDSILVRAIGIDESDGSSQADDSPPYSMLGTNSLATVLKASPVDLLLMDACLMGNAATLYQLYPGTDWVVASPENIPGNGQNYTRMLDQIHQQMETDISPAETGKSILKAFYEEYQNYGKTYYKDLMLYNLQGLQTLFSSPEGSLTIFPEDRLSHWRQDSSLRFYSINPLYSSEEYIELTDMLALAEEEGIAEAASLKEELSRSIFSVEDEPLLSLYFPPSYSSELQTHTATYQQMLFATPDASGWGARLSGFYNFSN